MSVEGGRPVFQKLVSTEEREVDQELLKQRLPELKKSMQGMSREELEALLKRESLSKCRATFLASIDTARKKAKPDSEDWKTLTPAETKKLLQKDLRYVKDRNRIADALNSNKPPTPEQVQCIKYNTDHI